MHITLHLAFVAVIGFSVSDARQQEHDVGEYEQNIYYTRFYHALLLMSHICYASSRLL